MVFLHLTLCSADRDQRGLNLNEAVEHGPTITSNEADDPAGRLQHVVMP